MSAPEVVIEIAPNGDVELMPFGFAAEEAALAATLPFRQAFPGGMLLMQSQFARGKSALAKAARALRARMRDWLAEPPRPRLSRSRVELVPDAARVRRGVRYILGLRGGDDEEGVGDLG